VTGPELKFGRCQCTGCGEFFHSTTVFDRHRVGAFEGPETASQRHCLTTADMLSKGWTLDKRGCWCRTAAEAVTDDITAPSAGVAATVVAEVSP
jgi:hypothetical protein